MISLHKLNVTNPSQWKIMEIGKAQQRNGKLIMPSITLVSNGKKFLVLENMINLKNFMQNHTRDRGYQFIQDESIHYLCYCVLQHLAIHNDW